MTDRKSTATRTSETMADTAVPTQVSAPPKARMRPRKLTIHNDTRIDNYYWLRDDRRQDPEVLDHLKTENAYFKIKTAHTDALQETLFNEIVGRIEQNDVSVPVNIGKYWYYTRYEKDCDYPIHVRRLNSPDAIEEIILNANELAEPYEYYHISDWETTDDHRVIAYAQDTVGRRQYDVLFKDLASGTMLPDSLTDTTGAMAWSANGEYLFYVKRDMQTLLPYQVWRHKLNTPTVDDELVYEEQDKTFNVTVYRGKSKVFIYMHIHSTITDEVRLLPADRPKSMFAIFLARERAHEYSVADVSGRFFILTNWQAKNFQIMETDLANANNRDLWRTVIPHSESVYLHDMEIFRDFLVLNERANGLRQLRVLSLTQHDLQKVIALDESAATSYLATNVDVDSKTLRYYYTSLTTPGTIYDYDMVSGKRELKKQDSVVDPNFDPTNYSNEYFSIDARDGARIPISLVYRKNMGPTNRRPLLIYGYGSYGACADPTFSVSRLSLLDRGFVYAIAHVRGGQELGRQWYENGRMFAKKNTFTDFIDASLALVDKGYGDPQRVFALGGSAGGLLMGAIVNMAPKCYRGVIAAVPFVDVVTTMLDESIPLTTGEFDEWGNPKIQAHFEYMKSYSPYDQVKRQDYPNLLVTTGLHDSQVQYWEPAKWVAKLREVKTDDNLLLLYTDMESGHGGSSGRFERQRDTAREYAFLIDLANLDSEAQQ